MAKVLSESLARGWGVCELKAVEAGKISQAL